MSKFYEHLTQIIPDFPMVHIMYVGDYDKDFIGFFEKYTEEKKYIFDVKILDKKENEDIEYEILDILSPKYHTNSYQYDILFLNLKKVPTDNLKHLFERVYACMKNAGGVIIVLPKQDDFALQLEPFLEEINYVAINPIDLDDEKKIVYAKKMHGWGGAR